MTLKGGIGYDFEEAMLHKMMLVLLVMLILMSLSMLMSLLVLLVFIYSLLLSFCKFSIKSGARSIHHQGDNRVTSPFLDHQRQHHQLLRHQQHNFYQPVRFIIFAQIFHAHPQQHHHIQ